jgi:hypothetical protein
MDGERQISYSWRPELTGHGEWAYRVRNLNASPRNDTERGRREAPILEHFKDEGAHVNREQRHGALVLDSGNRYRFEIKLS